MSSINQIVEEMMKKEKFKKRNSFFQEVILTFSNSKSKISSRKLERFLVFITFLVLSVIFIFRKIDDLSATDFIQIIGIWLTYAGFNTFQIRKDKVEEVPQNELS